MRFAAGIFAIIRDDDSKFSNFQSLREKIQVLKDVNAQNLSSVDVRSAKLSEAPRSDAENCMFMEWTEVDGNLKELLTEALNTTEHNLKNAQTNNFNGIKKELDVKLAAIHGKIIKSVDVKIKEMEGRLTKKLDAILKELKREN